MVKKGGLLKETRAIRTLVASKRQIHHVRLLDMVIHGILLLCDFVAVRTEKVTGVVANILYRRLRHLS